MAEKILMNELKQLSKETWVNVEVCSMLLVNLATDGISTSIPCQPQNRTMIPSKIALQRVRSHVLVAAKLYSLSR